MTDTQTPGGSSMPGQRDGGLSSSRPTVAQQIPSVTANIGTISGADGAGRDCNPLPATNNGQCNPATGAQDAGAGKLRALNLYAGIGGNRALWPEDVAVTAVERDPKIAAVYAKLFPQDTVICGVDAHEYLLANYERFDFIWSSPPCQSHSRMVKATRHKQRRYTDLSLYEEIMLLQKDFAGAWVVENVVPYYSPLIEPTFKVGRHMFWASDFCMVPDIARPKGFINTTNLAGRAALQDWLGLHFDDVIYYEGNHCPAQVLRNAVHPQIGLQIFNSLTDNGARIARYHMVAE